MLNQAEGVAAQPLEQYQGQQVANLTPDQQASFQEVENAQGQAQPYINSAQGNFNAATTPLFSEPNSGLNYIQQSGGTNVGAAGQPGIAAATAAANTNPANVSAYLSPYTSDVVNATQAEFNNENQQAQQQLAGQEVGEGAWGGNRTGIASANLANQEQLAQAPQIANLENTGYQTAESEMQQQEALQANTGISAANLGQSGAYQTGQLAAGAGGQELGANEANAWLNSQAGFGTAALGSEAQNEDLSGASAELQTGALEQSQNQANLNVPYEQYLQQQAYPFQTTNFLAGIAEGTGSAVGGTSSSSSTPSALSQITGLGEAGLGLNSIGAFNGLFGGSALDTLGAGLTGAEAETLGGIGALDSSALGASIGSEGLEGLGLLAGIKRGGAVPRRASGGIAAAANDDDMWTPPQRMTGTGGIQGYDGGGDVDDDVPTPTARPALASDPQQPEGTGIGGIAPAPTALDNFGYTPPTAPVRSRGQSADDIRSNAPGMALLTAGLATIGSGNIGKGGLEGVKYYTGQQDQADALDQKQADAADKGAYQSADLAAKGKELSDRAEEAKASLAQKDSEFATTSAEQAKRDKNEAKFQSGELSNMAAERRDAEAGTWTLVGTDPTTQQPMLQNTRTGAFKLGDLPIGAKPGIGTGASMGGREGVYTNRIIGAGNEAVASAENVMEMPMTTDRGWLGGRSQGPGLFDAVKEDFANATTDQDAKRYNVMLSGLTRNLGAIETSGLAVPGSLTHNLNSIVIQPGDDTATKLSKMAEIRQIAVQGLQPMLSNPRLPPEQKQFVQGMINRMEKAIPFTQHDITQFTTNGKPGQTFSDFVKSSKVGSAAAPSGSNGWSATPIPSTP